MDEAQFIERVVELYNTLNDEDHWMINSFYFASIVGAIIENKKMKIYKGNFTLNTTLQNKFDKEHWVWEYIDVIPYHIKKARWIE